MQPVLGGFAAASLTAMASLALAQPRLPTQSLSSYGMPGMIDMPTATTMPDGTLAVTPFAMGQAQRVTLAFQALPRVTVSFRYARLDDVSYRHQRGVPLHDRSFDLQWQVFNEGRYLPAVAVGLRDFIGTGAYSGEYVVATRSFSPRMRATLGMGWGRLATHGAFDNPLGALHPGFRTRLPGFSGPGGQFEVTRFFRGPAALFAGAEYQATDRLTLLAEYSSDAYRLETRSVSTTDPVTGVTRTTLPRMQIRTPVNLGFRYQASRSAAISGYVIGGRNVGLAASFALNPAQPSHGGVRVTVPAPVSLRPAPPQGGEFGTSWATPAAVSNPRIRTALTQALATEGVRLDSVDLEARRVVLRITNQRHDVLPRAIGRTARIMTGALPPSVEDIVIIPMHGGIAGTAVTLRRSDLERHALDPDGAARLLARARLSDPLGFPGVARLWQPLPEGRTRFAWGIAPYVQTSLFDPAQALRADVGLRATQRYSFAENLSANMTLSQRLFGNISQSRLSTDTITDPRFTSRVRTGAFRYSSDRPTVDRMTLDYTLRPATNLFGRVTLGWLERMYAGVSTELLWSPPDSRLALGIELNRVAQRDWASILGTLPGRQFTTGHVSAYYDFGAGYFGQVDAGRYLAGDVGATFRLERVFGSGMRVGAYATLTNMPFDQFGEGSFDKGITLTIPMTALLGRPSTVAEPMVLQSLNRDGGARLHVPGRLYPTIQQSRQQVLRHGWGAILQ